MGNRLQITGLGLRRLARVLAKVIRAKALLPGARTALARSGEGMREEGPSIFQPEVMLPFSTTRLSAESTCSKGKRP